ncbi:MAG TPA: nitrite reductase [Desulfobacterales bacterium]|nr:nitrite reductase [Desulfobacterales bacterium]
MNKKKLKKSITILLPAGLLPAELLTVVHDLAERYNLGIYLSTAQNIRLLDVKDENEEVIKKELLDAGAELKGPGKFPLPRICVGSQYCQLGMVNTQAFSNRILERFKNRSNVKPKFKIAVSACPASCSNPLTTDIGIRTLRNGFEVYAGGKGGPKPKVGRRIAAGVDEEQVLEIIEALVDFHACKTGKKQRLVKLIDDPEFPFAAV